MTASGSVNARVYNPKLGRFLQTDPIGYKDGMNWYAYVGNDPVNKVDPEGEAAFLIPLAIFIAKEIAGEAFEQVTGLPAPTVKGASKAIAKKLAKKVAKRPSKFRKKTIKDSWDNAAKGSKPNTKACPTCGKDVKGNPHKNEKRNGDDGWDNDHQPKWKDRDLSGKNRKEVLDEFNKDTKLRCIKCNRSDNQ